MHDLSLILEPATDDDAEPIERLNERVFGPGRYARTAYRIRETTDPDPALSFVARVGTLLVGASAMTPIVIGEASALLLGPLIVEPVFRSQGIGEALVNRSLEAAKAAGWKLVILVGDEPYYARMGFQRAPKGQISLAWTGRSRAAPLLRARARRAGGGEGRRARRLSASKRRAASRAPSAGRPSRARPRAAK